MLCKKEVNDLQNIIILYLNENSTEMKYKLLKQISIIVFGYYILHLEDE